MKICKSAWRFALAVMFLAGFAAAGLRAQTAQGRFSG